MQAIEQPITAKAEQIRTNFQALLEKVNKDNKRPQDVKASLIFLSATKVWSFGAGVASAGYLAELTVIENARITTAVKEC